MSKKEQVITHDGELIDVKRPTFGIFFKYIPALVIKKINTYVDKESGNDVFDSEYWYVYSLQEGIDVSSEEDSEYTAIDEVVKQVQTGVINKEFSLGRWNLDYKKIQEYTGTWDEFKVICLQIKFTVLEEGKYY